MAVNRCDRVPAPVLPFQQSSVYLEDVGAVHRLEKTLPWIKQEQVQLLKVPHLLCLEDPLLKFDQSEVHLEGVEPDQVIKEPVCKVHQRPVRLVELYHLQKFLLLPLKEVQPDHLGLERVPHLLRLLLFPPPLLPQHRVQVREVRRVVGVAARVRGVQQE